MDEMTKYSFTIEQSALRIASPISGVGKIEPLSFCVCCACTSNEIGLSSEINHYAHLALVVWTIQIKRKLFGIRAHSIVGHFIKKLISVLGSNKSFICSTTKLQKPKRFEIRLILENVSDLLQNHIRASIFKTQQIMTLKCRNAYQLEKPYKNLAKIQLNVC